MSDKILELSRKKIIIAAHRGTAAGNIPCNTLPAYRAALEDGADMIEIDVDMSADGKLYIFHPGMERAHLGFDGSIQKMTADEISALRYLNYDRTPTQFPLNTLDEVLEEFAGKCLINVDKFWGHPKEIYEAIKRHGMTDSVIVKSSPDEKVFTVLRELAPTLPYMPIVSGTHPLHEKLISSGINYIGAEVLFTSDSDTVATPEFIDMMHRDGKLVWVNSIIYNYKRQLAAGHSDDLAIESDKDGSWGNLARRGFDIIQTDWTGKISVYLDSCGLLYK
jgi:glycerophosphoryl diester phosphodiesterase